MTRYALEWGVLLVALLGPQSALAQPASDKPDAASQELEATIEKYVAAYNAGAIDQVMGYWAEDADFVDIGGEFHEGRDLIAALFRRGFASHPGRKLQLTSSARKLLAPDVAMDDGILELTDADGEKHRGRYTVVWTKVDGKWRIRGARDIPINDDPSPETPAAPPLEELAWLVGRWEAKADKYQITLDCQWQLDKSFLVQNFHVKAAEDDFRVVTYIAFDPVTARFRSWYFDSRGGFGGGAWTRRDNVYKTAVVSVLADGRIGSSVMTWEQVDENTAAWQAVEREIGGESMPDAKQQYVRVP